MLVWSTKLCMCVWSVREPELVDCICCCWRCYLVSADFLCLCFGLCCSIQEDSSCHLSALNAERDDLKALLLATLQRLEAVDEVVCRADKSSAMMEEKVRS